MSSPSEVIVLLEDQRQQMLLYRFLKRCEVAHRTRFRPSPRGRGSAEQWVRECFVKEVTACRRRQTRARTALIVVIDADTCTVQQRLGQLEKTLRDAGKIRIDDQEKIAILMPKRNIETWIICLTGEYVDEENDYKNSRNDWNELVPPAAETLFEWVRHNRDLPGTCIDSLRTGVAGLKRLDM